MYARGSGSGKSTAIGRLLPDVRRNAAAIFDTNLFQSGAAGDRVEEAVRAGKRVVVVYVYRDPVDAWVMGVLRRTRLERPTRIIPVHRFIESHIGAHQIAADLMAEGMDVRLIDNSLGVGKADFLPTEKFLGVRYNADALANELSSHRPEAELRVEDFLTTSNSLRDRTRLRARIRVLVDQMAGLPQPTDDVGLATIAALRSLRR